MKYAVTGGAGFIGSNLVERLIELGHDVLIIDNLSTGKKNNLHPNAQFLQIDLFDTDKSNELVQALDGVDTVFHCAAHARVQRSIKNPALFEKNNTLGLVNLLESCHKANIRRFVYSSSSSVYGDRDSLPSNENSKCNPSSPYALQKYYGEQCCKLFSNIYGVETVCLRYFNVYGEKQNIGGAYATVIGIFIDQKIKGLPLTINGNGKQRRDFTYVGDVVEANIKASTVKNFFCGEIINIGSGENISINELAKMIGGEYSYKNPVDEPFANLADVRKAREVLEWEPKTKVSNWINFSKEKKMF
tara:strand:- start:22649 stop:23557 length:909 start_codon:yes stop_codon:yes gene_type:complete